MEQIRYTVARPGKYGLLIALWIVVLSAVAATVYILFPPTERTVTESYILSDTHRPMEIYRYLRCQAKLEACLPYLADLEDGEYQAAFLGTYPLEYYEGEEFGIYRGINTLKLDPAADNIMELSGMLEQLTACDAPLERIYLGIDPVRLERHLSWEKDLDWEKSIAALIQEYEEIQWEVLLAYPSLAEWQKLPEEEREQAMAGYERAMEALLPVENLMLFYAGGQEWLICNQDNYEREGTLNSSVSHNMLLKIFCDQNYLVTEENREDMLEELEETLENWQEKPPEVKGHEEYTLVFLGDSVIGNYTDSLSVPGVVANFTGARVINCGYGGLCMSLGESGSAGVKVAEDLIANRPEELPEGIPARGGIQEFHSSPVANDRLVFFLNYGINDYMLGRPLESEDAYDVTTYKGAMRTALEQLMAAYPGAQIVVMTPTFINYYGYGTQTMSDVGGVMTDYVEAAVAVAGEYALPYMNNYEDMEVDAENEKELLADGVHPNEKGRFRMGLLICRKLNEILP
ncbi:MAG: SGNH/GDSL hydrolase family protein [Acetatifactor sp.]|nr:SGNH/GDSL hydrolase family protein [Acetatifactor sp.]